METQSKQLINTLETMSLESRKIFALYEALINGNNEEIKNPAEGSPLHSEFGKEFISSSVAPEDIPF